MDGNGFTAGVAIFYALALLVVVCAAGVAFSRNLLHAAFLLLGTLGGTAGLYLFAGADFVGVVQLLVYVGGVLVLLLFAVLLTNRIGEVRATNSSVSVWIALPITAFLAGGLAFLALESPWPTTEAVAAPTTLRLGDALLREYLLPFELISVVLLVSLIGAMVLARRAVRPGLRAGAAAGDSEISTS